MYNPSADCGDEVHTIKELHDKLVAYNKNLQQQPERFLHRIPDQTGHYDTLRGDYQPTLPQEEVDAEINRAKKLKSPRLELEQWRQFGHPAHFDAWREQWLIKINQIDKDHIEGTTRSNGTLSIDRFNYKDVSYEWFVKNYEQPGLPCMISGFADEWPLNTYTSKDLVQALGKESVKVGKDDSGRRVGVPMDAYMQYMHTQHDDNPVYLFESQLDRTATLSKILDTWKSPEWFSSDLFNYCHPERRPPHRWFCVGPKASGTTMHWDPLCTNAWNTLIAGRKLWLAIEPTCPEDLANGNPFMSKEFALPNPETSAIGWYNTVYPKLRAHMERNGNKYKLREFIQYPGETIFIPGSWHHFVLNFDDTLAVTQNYVNMSNFNMVWRDMRVERRHTAQRWLAFLKERFPLAYETAIALNTKDNWSLPLRQPHKVGRFHTSVALIKQKIAAHGQTAVTGQELADVQTYDRTHDPTLVRGPSDAPFQYSVEWKYFSGSSDSSTDSDESSSSSDDDDSDDETEQPTEEKPAVTAQ